MFPLTCLKKKLVGATFYYFSIFYQEKNRVGPENTGILFRVGAFHFHFALLLIKKIAESGV